MVPHFVPAAAGRRDDKEVEIEVKGRGLNVFVLLPGCNFLLVTVVAWLLCKGGCFGNNGGGEFG